MNKRIFLSLVVGGLGLVGGVIGEETKKSSDGAVHLDAKKAKALIDTGAQGGAKPIVLDVRTGAEFSEGHLKGAKNIDFRDDSFRESVSKLDRKKPYLVHCRSGGRSGASLKIFKELGFEHIYHLDGGMLGWEKAGLPVVRPKL